MNKKSLSFILFTIGCVISMAQKITIEDFQKLDRDMSARTANMRDINGELCALLKIETTEKGFHFQGLVERTEQKVGEIYVYISPGMRFMTIKHPDFGMLRNYEFPQTIESGVVYRMKLSTEAKEVKMDTANIGKVVDNKLNELLEKKLSEIDLNKEKQAKTINIQQINDNSKMTNWHEYVDLGLSVKWATCNVGSSSSDKLGNYYAWGETDVKKKYSKNNSTTYGKETKNIATKKRYDIAAKAWKEPWRIPTVAEFRELIDSCTWMWANLNGMNGYKITGPNGNSIFIPATGIMYDDTQIANSGKIGNYWTANSDSSTTAYCFSLNNTTYNVADLQRFYGMNIRPVIGKDKTYFFITANYEYRDFSASRYSSANRYSMDFYKMASTYGLEIGYVKKKFGLYANAMTNFDFSGFSNADVSFSDDEVENNHFTGNVHYSHFSANVGILLGGRIINNFKLYFKAGGGYRFNTFLWELEDKRWAKIEPDCCKSINAEAGLFVIVGNSVFSVNFLNIYQDRGGASYGIRLGIGVNF